MDITCPDLVDRRGRDVRPGLRRARGADIRAIVLHQTTGSTFTSDRQQRWLAAPRGTHRVDRISAHFVVLQNGLIYYTHDVTDYRSGSAGRGRGIDIEFAGRFPHTDEPDPASRMRVEMIRAGRNLVTALFKQMPNITHIHPHGQVQGRQRSDNSVCGGFASGNPCGSLENCPGPDIWMNVGHWATGALGLVSDPPLAELGFPVRGIEPAQQNPAYVQDGV